MLHCILTYSEMKRKTQLELSTFCLVSYMSSKIAQSPVEIARIQMLNKIQERKKWRKFIIAILSIIYVPTRTLIYTRSTEHRWAVNAGIPLFLHGLFIRNSDRFVYIKRTYLNSRSKWDLKNLDLKVNNSVNVLPYGQLKYIIFNNVVCCFVFKFIHLMSITMYMRNDQHWSQLITGSIFQACVNFTITIH